MERVGFKLFVYDGVTLCKENAFPFFCLASALFPLYMEECVLFWGGKRRGEETEGK